jgi:hypothetical protein
MATWCRPNEAFEARDLPRLQGLPSPSEYLCFAQIKPD